MGGNHHYDFHFIIFYVVTGFLRSCLVVKNKQFCEDLLNLFGCADPPSADWWYANSATVKEKLYQLQSDRHELNRLLASIYFLLVELRFWSLKEIRLKKREAFLLTESMKKHIDWVDVSHDETLMSYLFPGMAPDVALELLEEWQLELAAEGQLTETRGK